MKKIVLLMAFLAAGMTASAEERNENVTLSDAEMAPLTVIDDEVNDGGVKISKGKDDDDRWSTHIFIGGNIVTGAPDNVDFSYWQSWDINWTILQYDYRPKNSKMTLSAGLGFDWRKYPLSGHHTLFFKDGADVVNVGPSTAGMDDLHSDIHTTSLSMPLLAKYSFSKNFAISLGGQLNWNYYGRIKNSWENGDIDYHEYTKKIGQRPITVDVLGIVHLWSVGIYCKYCPMSVLKKDRGTEFKSVALGVYF